MIVYILYIFDRNGICLYYMEWNRKKQLGMSKDEVEQKIYMFFVCQFCLNDQILVLLYYIEKYYEVIIDFMIIVYIYICLFVYVFNYQFIQKCVQVQYLFNICYCKIVCFWVSVVKVILIVQWIGEIMMDQIVY